VAILEPASEFVVAVGEDVGLDGHEIAGDTLHGEAATVDLWCYTFDYDAAERLVGVRRYTKSSFHAL
jgi:YD repeat-containing protein